MGFILDVSHLWCFVSIVSRVLATYIAAKQNILLRRVAPFSCTFECKTVTTVYTAAYNLVSTQSDLYTKPYCVFVEQPE